MKLECYIDVVEEQLRKLATDALEFLVRTRRIRAHGDENPAIVVNPRLDSGRRK